MMKKIITSLFVLSASTAAFCCEVHLPQHFIVFDKNADLTASATHTSCSDEILKEVNETLKSVDGKISGFQLSDILKGKNHDVVIRPNLINVQQFQSLVREHLALPSETQLTSLISETSPDFVTLNYGEKVEIECSNCQFIGHETLNLKVNSMDGAIKSFVLQAEFKKMIKAYRVSSTLPAFSEITSTVLKEEYVQAIPHTNLVTSLENLRFFKLNKPIRAGELLRKEDLNALSLVKAGMKTEVIIENAQVRLKTSGISRSNGSHGDFVEVFHPQKNKKYLGKVIDINKVLVEL